MPKGKTEGLTDREQLETKIAATVQWEFGHGICDFIEKYAPDVIPQTLKEEIKRVVRTAGNNVIRVTRAHLDHYSVVRRSELDRPNLNRVAKKAGEL